MGLARYLLLHPKGLLEVLIKLRIDDTVDAVPVHFANGM